MLKLVLGFPDRSIKSDPTGILYLGQDGEEALAALKKGGDGVAISRLYHLPIHYKQYDLDAEAKAEVRRKSSKKSAKKAEVE